MPSSTDLKQFYIFRMGASVDQTMATWGGSTVDNLESITEDGVAQDNEDEDDNDSKFFILMFLSV